MSLLGSVNLLQTPVEILVSLCLAGTDGDDALVMIQLLHCLIVLPFVLEDVPGITTVPYRCTIYSGFGNYDCYGTVRYGTVVPPFYSTGCITMYESYGCIAMIQMISRRYKILKNVFLSEGRSRMTRKKTQKKC